MERIGFSTLEEFEKLIKLKTPQVDIIVVGPEDKLKEIRNICKPGRIKWEGEASQSRVYYYGENNKPLEIYTRNDLECCEFRKFPRF